MNKNFGCSYFSQRSRYRPIGLLENYVKKILYGHYRGVVFTILDFISKPIQHPIFASV